MSRAILLAYVWAASLAFVVAGCGSCAGALPSQPATGVPPGQPGTAVPPGQPVARVPPGQPAAEVAGVAMPAGTLRVQSEDGTGYDGLSFTTVWLVTPLPPPDAAAFFRRASGEADAEATSFHLPGDVRISVTPIAEIPQTRMPPSRPVLAAPPSGMAAWIEAYTEASGSCPPCPPGFVGTLVPSCNCPRRGSAPPTAP